MGRDIMDNIMMAHKLVQYYERKGITPRVCMKVDIRKAFDSISWSFLQNALTMLGFPTIFINWIIACITTPTFSILVNGTPYGHFPGKKGLRPGDPLSLLLFVICMEILSRALRHLPHYQSFRYHPKCHRNQITHLTFC